MTDTAAEVPPPAWERLQVYLAMTVGSKVANDVLDLARQVAMDEREACAKLADAAGALATGEAIRRRTED
jgi:hypothetical protein